MNTLNALIITVFLIIGILIFYVRFTTDDEFDKWFTDLKLMALSYGYTLDETTEFESSVWREYFLNGLTIEEALKESLSE